MNDQPNAQPPQGPPPQGPPPQGPTDQGAPYEGGPYQGAPYQGGPYQGGPYQGARYQGAPYQGGPYQGAPYQGAPAFPHGPVPPTASMQPAYPPAAPEPTSPDLAAKLKSLKPEKVLPWLVGGLFVFIVAAALVAEAVNSPSDTFTMEGSLTLYDSTTRSYGYGEEFDCEGDGGYSDIYPGRDILVYGVDESLIAKGEFVSSDKTGSTCSMHFAVEDVPRGEQFYQLEISDRGRMTYSEDEAQESIGLSLGD